MDYFFDLLSTHSWSAVKLDLYGLKFFYRHVLRKHWKNVDLIKPPKAVRLPDIVTVGEAASLFKATHKLSYKIFYFTVYSLGSVDISSSPNEYSGQMQKAQKILGFLFKA